MEGPKPGLGLGSTSRAQLHDSQGAASRSCWDHLEPECRLCPRHPPRPSLEAKFEPNVLPLPAEAEAAVKRCKSYTRQHIGGHVSLMASLRTE